MIWLFKVIKNILIALCFLLFYVKERLLSITTRYNRAVAGDSSLYENVVFNLDPEFLGPQQNKLQIPLNSSAAGLGVNAGNLNTDITETLRPSPSDLGAYNATDFED